MKRPPNRSLCDRITPFFIYQFKMNYIEYYNFLQPHHKTLIDDYLLTDFVSIGHQTQKACTPYQPRQHHYLCDRFCEREPLPCSYYAKRCRLTAFEYAVQQFESRVALLNGGATYLDTFKHTCPRCFLAHAVFEFEHHSCYYACPGMG